MFGSTTLLIPSHHGYLHIYLLIYNEQVSKPEGNNTAFGQRAHQLLRPAASLTKIQAGLVVLSSISSNACGVADIQHYITLDLQLNGTSS